MARRWGGGPVAIVGAGLTLVERWFSARIGEGLIYDLRTQVFSHVLREPVAFFTRAQTGALVTRLGNDVIGAQQAFTSVLSSVVSNAVALVLIIVAMASLSWPLTLGCLALVPFFLVPARLMGRRLASLAHEQFVRNAEVGTRMTERFNVAGALLGQAVRPPRRRGRGVFRPRRQGARHRRPHRREPLGLLRRADLGGVAGDRDGLRRGRPDGGQRRLTVGTLLALTALLSRLYGPLTAISNVHVDILTALVSFERVFEVLDLEPLVAEAPDALPVPPGPVRVEVDGVSFSYPSADEVSLASLETTATGDRRGSGPVLHDVSFTVEPGSLVALVGPSGAGKTTITSLVARLYDPAAGAIRINGLDLRDAQTESLHDAVGVVTQDAHLFHDTIRANLAYAAPSATEDEMVAALRAAQVWSLIEALPSGLDTVVGDRGHRLSGGEKQRLAIARLLLKGPGLIVLDEATAHLDSESEQALQRALDHALRDRSALVIAHRLSTVRHADQILVVDDGTVVERGTHHELVAAGGLYSELYNTQFDASGRNESHEELPV